MRTLAERRLLPEERAWSWYRRTTVEIAGEKLFTPTFVEPNAPGYTRLQGLNDRPGMGFYIEFRHEFSFDMEPDYVTVMIYNMSPFMRYKIVTDERLILRSGYVKNDQILFDGPVRFAHTYAEGTENITEIECYDASTKTMEKELEFSLKRGVSARVVVTEALKRAGVAEPQKFIGTWKPARRFTYEEEQSYSGTVRQIIEQCAEDLRSIAFIRRGKLHMVRPWWVTETDVMIHPNFGMVGSPRRIDSDDARQWDVTNLMLPEIGAGDMVTIISKSANARFQVIRGQHLSTAAEHITRLEVGRDWIWTLPPDLRK